MFLGESVEPVPCSGMQLVGASVLSSYIDQCSLPKTDDEAEIQGPGLGGEAEPRSAQTLRCRQRTFPGCRL